MSTTTTTTEILLYHVSDKDCSVVHCSSDANTSRVEVSRNLVDANLPDGLMQADAIDSCRLDANVQHRIATVFHIETSLQQRESSFNLPRDACTTT